MEIQMLRAIIFEDTLNGLCRRAGPQPVDARTLLPILEKEGADGRPLVLFVAGVRPGEKPGRWSLREVRKLLVYQSKAFLKVEKIRLEEEKEVAALAARTFRLDQIKVKLRAELKADDESFDKKYDEQIEGRVEIAEAEIEKEAAAILKVEEEQLNK